MPIPPMKELEDAELVLRQASRVEEHCEEFPAPTLASVTAAGLAVLKALELARDELAFARAASRRLGSPSQFPGDLLMLGRDSGGPRHFLAERRVPAGTPLALLTQDGWLSGRYESDRAIDGTVIPHFHFRLAGVAGSSYVVVPTRALLAWPEDVRQ